MAAIINKIRHDLLGLQDLQYKAFTQNLIPNLEADVFIGVRTPALRSYAKTLAKEHDLSAFLTDLPHQYFEENQLHGFLLEGIKAYAEALQAVETFLPFIDNWATCDQRSPKVFRKHPTEMLEKIRQWLRSNHTYTVRYAIGLLMSNYLDEYFSPAILDLVAALRSKEYYINMMIAWFFSTALCKCYESALPILLNRRLATWTHNKTIQKALESRLISAEAKHYLRTLKLK